jgi:hypothetical protein
LSTSKATIANNPGVIQLTRLKSWLCISFVLISLPCFCEDVFARDDWSISFYRAILLEGNLSDASLLWSGFEPSYLLALALSKRVASHKEKIDVEIEGQVVKHDGDQSHWEFNGLGALRWLPFVWDRYIDTSFAAGAGLSYATEIPKVEERRRGEGQVAKLLVYLMLELDFALPKVPNWHLITRVHHRSGAFGLIDGVTGGSNAVGLGIRYTF